MEDLYQAQKRAIQNFDPKNSTDEQEGEVVKLMLSTLVDIAQSLNRIANKP